MSDLNGTGPDAAPAPEWVLEFGGRRWTSTDVTVAHAVLVAQVLGDGGWRVATPTAGPPAAAAWLAVLLASELDEPLEACLMLVNQLPLAELVDAVT
jgi:hypothetical protein